MSNNFEIIDNFLPRDVFGNLKNDIMGSNFSWFYNPQVATLDKKDPYFYFTHTFFTDYRVNSHSFYLIEPILEKIKPEALIRARANLYTNLFHDAKNENHYDFNYTHKGMILYVNTNNGKTIIDDEYVIDSVENRALIFDPSVQHCSTHPTDSKVRVNISINYF